MLGAAVVNYKAGSNAAKAQAQIAREQAAAVAAGNREAAAAAAAQSEAIRKAELELAAKNAETKKAEGESWQKIALIGAGAAVLVAVLVTLRK